MRGGCGLSRVGSRGHSPLTEGGRGRGGIPGLYRPGFWGRISEGASDLGRGGGGEWGNIPGKTSSLAHDGSTRSLLIYPQIAQMPSISLSHLFLSIFSISHHSSSPLRGKNK